MIAPAKDIWSRLQRHLERTERFTLVLLTSGDPSALDALCRCLETQAPCLQIITFTEAGLCWAEMLEATLAPDERLIQLHAPVWLSLDHHPNDPSADQKRDAVLAALNQFRTPLERSFRRPLLIALPSPYISRIWEIAPDLWTIRGAVIQIP